MQKDLAGALRGVEAMILAVPHAPYLELAPEDVVRWAGGPIAVVDCYGILSDDTIRRYFELGCEVKGLGRGHLKRLKDEAISKSGKRESEKAKASAEPPKRWPEIG